MKFATPGARAAAQKHGRQHYLGCRQLSGLILLTILSFPATGMVATYIFCLAGGNCIAIGWTLLPTCLLTATRRKGDVSKWRNFLRSAASMPRTDSDPSADDAAADIFPPHQWEPWDLPKKLLKNFPEPENARLDPALFHLHIKFLTFSRMDDARRSLNSLTRADYEGDAVSLEIFLDHPYDKKEGWGKMTEEQQRRVLQKRQQMVEMVDSVVWPHGPKKTFLRTLNAGIQPQWMEAFWPENVNEFAFVVEDDTEVSPYYYVYLKRLIMHYYYTKSNFNPMVYGISFQRQWFVPAKGGNRLVSPPQPFLYQLVGTWGQVLFPIPWKDFRVWYDVSRYTRGLEPILGNMVTTQFWYKKGNSIWTHWQVHFVYIRNYFNIYTGFPGNLSLSVCYRSAGVNIKKAMGADTSMITREVLHNPAIPASERDPRSGLPLWWTQLPGMEDMSAMDFCFRRIPNWRTPVTSFRELQRLLPLFNATQEVAVVPVPDTAEFAYKLMRNWLCHVDGSGRHNYILLITLHPLKDNLGRECPRAAQHNSEMVEMARDLAGRNHLVYVQDDLASGAPAEVCIEKTPRLFLSRHQAGLVQNLLESGVDTMVLGVSAFWRVNPFPCFKAAAALKGVPSLGRFLEPHPMGGTWSASVLWVEGSQRGTQLWKSFQGLWSKYNAAGMHGLPLSAVGEAQKLINGVVLTPVLPPATAPPGECAVVAPWIGPAPGANASSPAIILAPAEDAISSLRDLKLWELHDIYNCCRAVKCSLSV